MNGCRILVLLLAVVPACAAQDTEARSDAAAVPPLVATTNGINCQNLATKDAGLDLIAKFCEFALTYRHQLPDFIVQQTTTFRGTHPATVVTAQVTFRKGMEHYSYLTLNGKPLTPESSLSRDVGFRSAGEFGSLLVDLFTLPGAVEFKFRKASAVGDVPVSIYEFHLPQDKNTFWSLRDGNGRAWKPEFRGEVWLEQKTGRPLREEIEPVHLPAECQIESAKTTTDYAMTPVKEVGTFLLPVKSESKVCGRSSGSETALGLILSDPTLASLDAPARCTTNVLVFHDYRKFAATSRVLPGFSEP